MEQAFIVTFSIMLTLMFFIIGGIIGWLTNKHLLENRLPYMHPEMFDNQGNLIPDEILALRFENDYDFEYDNEEEDE